MMNVVLKNIAYLALLFCVVGGLFLFSSDDDDIQYETGLDPIAVVKQKDPTDQADVYYPPERTHIYEDKKVYQYSVESHSGQLVSKQSKLKTPRELFREKLDRKRQDVLKMQGFLAEITTDKTDLDKVNPNLQGTVVISGLPDGVSAKLFVEGDPAERVLGPPFDVEFVTPDGLEFTAIVDSAYFGKKSVIVVYEQGEIDNKIVSYKELVLPKDRASRIPKELDGY